MQVSDDPRVGTELAGYRIESLLGWGGMSVVYLAKDLRLKRRVALKLLAWLMGAPRTPLEGVTNTSGIRPMYGQAGKAGRSSRQAFPVR